MFVCVLFAFWCMLTNNKVLETIWGQRGSKSSFMVKIGMGFLGNPKFGLPVWCSLSGELELAMTSCLVQHPCFRRSGYLGVDSDFPKCFFWCVWLLFSLRNLLEHKMDRIKIYFVNQIETYLKNVQEREIFRKSFFSSTMMELWLFTVTMSLEWVCNEYIGLELGFTLKMHYFWKMWKWDELMEFLEIIGMELCWWYIWATLMLCDIRNYLVAVFKHGYFVFGELLENVSF